MARVHETLQQIAAFADASDIDGLTAYVGQLVPGEMDEIADQLTALGKGEQAKAIRALRERAAAATLTPGQRDLAERAGISAAAYAARYAEMLARKHR